MLLLGRNVTAICLLWAALGAESLPAATVTHIYELSGSLSDELGGPALTMGGGTLTATHDLFGEGQGPSLSQGIDARTYSIELLFSIDTTAGYRKLLDFKNVTADQGLYNLNGSLYYFPTIQGPANQIPAGVAVHLVVTRDDVTDLFVAYLNGVQQFSFTDNTKLAVFSGENRIIRFFLDDNSDGAANENASGSLDRVRIYDGVLTANEVRHVYQGGAPPGLVSDVVPEPASLTVATCFALLSFAAAGWRKKSR